MPLDINTFRNNPELIRESQRRRHADPLLVDTVIALDNDAKNARHTCDLANAELRKISKQIGIMISTGDPTADILRATIPQLHAEIASKKEACKAADILLSDALCRIGNIVDTDVVVSNDEKDNETIRRWGEFAVPTVGGPNGKLREHFDLLEMISGYDTVRGARVAGSRGYFLTGIGAQLNLALIQYATNFLAQRDYTALQVPLFMRPDMMSKTAQLADFDEQLYKTVDGNYLIATSEQPISCMHAGEWISPTELPLKYAGVSTCFRKEAGKTGHDVRGIFRVHQFDKVEQFVICSPEDSARIHTEMTRVSEEFLESLGLSYRTVSIVSGALNDAATKKYDIEGWFPAFGDCRELVSSSNCTDYQSRALDIRFGYKKTGVNAKTYVHMLNATLCATTRVICCIIENYQTDTGIIIPEVLRVYLNGKDFIPFK